MKKRKYFVTGTDTGVGKTFVLSLMLEYLKSKGERPLVMKPVETGCTEREGELFPEDALKLSAITGQDVDEVCPCRFSAPLAPLVAARQEGKKIDFSKVIKLFQRLSVSSSTPFFVEGAGGLMVPVTENILMIDVPMLLGLSVILVSRLSLGAINHTLLSVEALNSRGVDITGIILNDCDGIKTAATETNAAVIDKMIPGKLMGQVPFGFSSPERLDRHLNLERL